MQKENPWSAVPINRFCSCAMSPPRPGPWWRGIMVRAPEEIFFTPGKPATPYGEFAIVPLCGYHLVEVNRKMIGEPMRIVAKNLETDQVYEGPIRPISSGSIVPPPPDSPDLASRLLPGQAFGGFFNPNLVNFVPIPPEAASYEVFVRLGDAYSNRVIIHIKTAG